MGWVATSVGVSAFGAYSSAQANNKAQARTKEEAERRYKFQSKIAMNQMDEQHQDAFEKMTDVTKQFLVAKSQANVIQAETGIASDSKTSRRIKSVRRLKERDAKGKIAKEIDTNVINIANDMLAKKIDTDATIREAESKKKNVFTETVLAGAGAYAGAKAMQGAGGSKVETTKGLSGTDRTAPAVEGYKDNE